MLPRRHEPDLAGLAAFTLDPGGRVVCWSVTATALFGPDACAAIGHDVCDVLMTVPGQRELVGHALAEVAAGRVWTATVAGGSLGEGRFAVRWEPIAGPGGTVLVGCAAFGRAPASPAFNPGDVARALQRGLLPGQPDIPAGMEVAHAYLPVGDHVVGGDWHDIVPLPGGRAALIVGDAMGHGPEAAAVMVQLRTAAHTRRAGGKPHPDFRRRTGRAPRRAQFRPGRAGQHARRRLPGGNRAAA